MDQPIFKNRAEEISWMRTNKEFVIAQKKMIIKCADIITHSAPRINDHGDAIKADGDSISLEDVSTIKVRSIINTTNLMDSHSDVHIKGLWKKSLDEKKDLYLLQEHQMKFSHIISDNVKAIAKSYPWKELGYEYEGNTQALVFDSLISKERNEFMFEQYAKGYVKNHSVGMRYVQLAFASNDDRYPDEVVLWNKYYSSIANKDAVDAKGYFFPITEAKIIEGSAVPMGSNPATPTMSVSAKDIQPPSGTETEPPKGTPSKSNKFFY